MPPKMLQHEPEMAAFLALVKREKVISYLEIGSKFGGSLWQVANVLPEGSRVVSVDLENTKTIASLRETIRELHSLGFKTSLRLGDSTSPKVVAEVKALGPFDLVLIDANHTLPYATKDWTNYGPMGRIVAFHDIAWKRPVGWNGGLRIDVPQLWDEIKTNYRYEEIKLDPTGQDNGFGILWR